MPISFRVSAVDANTIRQIVDRAVSWLDASSSSESCTRMELSIDITACHANGTPLRLADLLTADDTNFAHDVFGIHRYINRETGQLEDCCFRPRFAVPESDIGRTFDGEVYEVKTV